jgi:hypothetical protein
MEWREPAETQALLADAGFQARARGRDRLGAEETGCCNRNVPDIAAQQSSCSI